MKPTSTFSIRLHTEELERYRALAKQHDMSLNRWIKECIDRSLETWFEWTEVRVEKPEDEVQIDWRAMQALAVALDRWQKVNPGTHSMKDAIEWLSNLAAPLAQEQLLLATRESKEIFERLEAFSQDFGRYLDAVRKQDAPHDGIASLIELARALMRGEIAIAGKELLERLKAFENELKAIDTDKVTPIGRAKKQIH